MASIVTPVVRAVLAATASRGPVCAAALAVALATTTSTGCATVAPQDRAILADPTMQFEAESKHESSLRHAIENREGSTGGTGVGGGGCGCN
ncbi:MAG: DUF4266 domain-containing protein [Myxococcota bacterium]|nr:DUF4266 domain-containing protein [Myxococcota bacterium]